MIAVNKCPKCGDYILGGYCAKCEREREEGYESKPTSNDEAEEILNNIFGGFK